jgi:hypothetical protein
MELFGYDENGELAFRQGPFTFDIDAIKVFYAEKDFMVEGGIFHLSLEKTYLAVNHKERVYMSAVR